MGQGKGKKTRTRNIQGLPTPAKRPERHKRSTVHTHFCACLLLPITPLTSPPHPTNTSPNNTSRSQGAVYGVGRETGVVTHPFVCALLLSLITPALDEYPLTEFSLFVYGSVAAMAVIL